MYGMQPVAIGLDAEPWYLPGHGLQVVDQGADVGEDRLGKRLPAVLDQEAGRFQLPRGKGQVPSRVVSGWCG